MFSIKTYGKSEFAMMMFPDISDPKIAQNKLRRWIKLDPEFHQQIQRLADPSTTMTTAPPRSG